VRARWSKYHRSVAETRWRRNGAVIQNIQALRAIAAGMVFLIHLLSMHDGTWLDVWRYRYWWIGPAGVDIFFVISGFIISLAAAGASRRATTRLHVVVPFALKRVVRIYPVYWIVLALAFVAAPHVTLAPDWMSSYHHSPLRLALLATTQNDKILAAWTLCYEMYFYVVLTAILLLAPRRVFALLLIWTAVEAIAIVIAGSVDIEWLRNVPTSPLLLEFSMGCGVGYLISRGITRGAAACLFVGLVWFGLGAWIHSRVGNWEPWWRTPTFGIAAAFIVYGLVGSERRGTFVLPAWLCKFGDPSYSVYIWHQLVLAVFEAVAAELDLFYRLPALLVFAIATIAVLAVALASYRWIERPLLEGLHHVLARRARTAAVASSPSV
jgi:peptidoglycan/LPS O-acetylase OafA/YrhL